MSDTKELSEIEKHYEESRRHYDIEGESHLEYYKSKFPDNYKILENGTRQ